MVIETWKHKFNNIIFIFSLRLPDLVMYNNAADFTDFLMNTNAMVHYDGKVFWPVPTKLQSTCKVDVTFFPFDVQTCRLKFGKKK